MNTAVCIRHDVERELRRVDWADVGIRLTAYATWKARNLHWRTGRTDALAAGKTPEDIAADAILKVLGGERAWDPNRGPLLAYLESVVDSLMSHLAASMDNRIQERWTEGQQGSDVASAGDGGDERIDRLRAALAKEKQDSLVAIIDAIATQCDPQPQAIALHLRTTVADINNRLKRLRRFALRMMRESRITGASAS